MSPTYSQLGFVVIGRNEAPRLGTCLAALAGRGAGVVYVDSGSTDDSLHIARTFNADIVELSRNEPFTAARARNAGARQMHESRPDVQFVQFLDGDCAMLPAWIDAAMDTMARDPQAAVVAGRVRERRPEASIYNRLCDLEWSVLSGKSDVCGGNSLIRMAAFRQVGGFEQGIMSGEEADLCRRLGKCGWTVRVLPADMVLHDSAIYRFNGWWRRAVREGHCIAEEAWREGFGLGTSGLRGLASVWLWSVLLPMVAAAAAWPTYGLSLPALLGVYGLQWVRIAHRRQRTGWPPADAQLYATFTLIGKFAAFIGTVRFFARTLLKRPCSIIDHKTPGAAAPCTETP